MPNNRNWRGLYVALATPLADQGTPHRELLAARAQTLLAQGCDGIALFGTTGEGPAFPVAERIAGLEALLTAAIPPERLVVAASATAAGDALALTRHALAMGVSDVLLTPPFFLKAVDDDGVFRFYAEHIARAGSNRLRLLLYHIPSVTGIALGAELIDRLASAFPDVVIGVKDSGADWHFTRQLLERFPQLQILCGEETHLPQALAQGGAGTICGMANFVPELIAPPDRPARPGRGGGAARAAARIKRTDGAQRLVPSGRCGRWSRIGPASRPGCAACRRCRPCPRTTGRPWWRRSTS